tara:strand:- start:449 stop:685 length:237 start_codon:yes stop_codon:yes gene_type:complete
VSIATWTNYILFVTFKLPINLASKGLIGTGRNLKGTENLSGSIPMLISVVGLGLIKPLAKRSLVIFILYLLSIQLKHT